MNLLQELKAIQQELDQFNITHDEHVAILRKGIKSAIEAVREGEDTNKRAYDKQMDVVSNKLFDKNSASSSTRLMALLEDL